jgi:CBS domain-containing protein
MNTLYKNILRIKNSVLVKDVMTNDVVCLRPDELVSKAVGIMSDKSISTIVITVEGRLEGVVTERDLVSRILKPGKDPKKTRIRDVMSKSPKSIGLDATLLQASNKMKQEHVRKLVVVDADNQVIGLVSQTDIVNNLQKIDESYRSLLGNPVFTLAIIAVVMLLFIINILFFK